MSAHTEVRKTSKAVHLLRMYKHNGHCSRAEVKGSVLACQEANFLHCNSDKDSKSDSMTLG